MGTVAAWVYWKGIRIIYNSPSADLPAFSLGMILTVALAALCGLAAANPIHFLHSRCHENGQILPDKHGDTCQFQVCDYGDEPWVDEHGKIRFLEVTFSCPKGSSTNPHKFNPKHPCEINLDNGGRCTIKHPIHPFIHKFPIHPIHPIVHPVHPVHPPPHCSPSASRSSGRPQTSRCPQATPLEQL